jgi:hypothetical protein
MSKKEAGRLGGRATVERYGREHMRDLAHRWHEKYKLVKYGIDDWLIVERTTGKALSKTLNGRHYNERGK